MRIATHNDIVGLCPGIQDHAVVEILQAKATVDELEAALAVMTSDDKDLIEAKRREGGQIHRLLGILRQADLEVVLEREQ